MTKYVFFLSLFLLQLGMNYVTYAESEALQAGAFRDRRIIEIIYSEDPTVHRMVRIDAGRNDGLLVGDIFSIYRKKIDRFGLVTVPIGKIKVAELNADHSFATIVDEKTEISMALFPKFPMVMAGDYLERFEPQIEFTQVISPIMTLAYRDLFVDPLDHPHSYEISESGKKLLKEAFAEFADIMTERLAIEAYTDDFGPAASNQLESTQRAAIIRQYAINELGFDAGRLTALGFGENNQLDQNYTPDYREINRRIVIKVLPKQALD